MDTGVLFGTDTMSGRALIDFARQVDAAGIESLWVAELFGREPFATAATLLAATQRVRIATGIANVYARDAVAAATGAATLSEFSGGRFVLGLGVSNASLNEIRGHAWQAPVPRMQAYLEALRAVRPTLPEAHAPRCSSRRTRRVSRLGRDLADGITTYLMTPEHTRKARAVLGEGPQLTAMMMVLRCTDAERARDIARRATRMYTRLDYYHRAWSQLGFGPEDFGREPSDRLIDALVAWGDVDAIRARMQAHRDAGASRVVVIPPLADDPSRPDVELIEAVAQ